MKRLCVAYSDDHLKYYFRPTHPYKASAIKVDGTVKCIDRVVRKTCMFGFNPSGFHHARPDRAAGFCVFNDIAIGVRYLQKYYNLKRIVIFNMDVHHGFQFLYVCFGSFIIDRVLWQIFLRGHLPSLETHIHHRKGLTVG